MMHAALFVLLAQAQPPVGVSQAEIDQAIRRGADHLQVAPSTSGWMKGNCDELILLTMIAAEVPPTDAKFQEYLANCLSAPLEKTYKVSLLAMALEELDPSAYQMRIAQCAKFLVDNQAKNGQWDYGKAADLSAYPFVEPKKSVKSGGKAREFVEAGERKRPSKVVSVVQTRTVGDSGDNSNSQYAALGLRACFDSNVRIPVDVVARARRWWVECQWPDESGAAAGKDAVNSGMGTTQAQGWSYSKSDKKETKPTYTMTAGGVGATVIYEYMLGRDFKKDRVTQAAVNWLGKRFSIHEDYYYLYALERAGMLYDTQTFGTHDWYREGARYILDRQKPDGSWGKRAKPEENTWDTCFAILFLKKATRAIATGDRR